MGEQGKRGWQGQGRRGRPHGDRPVIDRGTPELRAHRERLAAGGDPALSEYPLVRSRVTEGFSGCPLNRRMEAVPVRSWSGPDEGFITSVLLPSARLR